MVALMLAGVMFPLWPPIMRLGVWYLSIGMLGLIGLFFAIAGGAVDILCDYDNCCESWNLDLP